MKKNVLNSKLVLVVLFISTSVFATEFFDPANLPNCRAQISKRLCKLSAEDDLFQSPCRRLEAKIETAVAEKLEKFYDVMPLSFQKYFCSLDEIRIASEGEGFASDKQKIVLPYLALMRENTPSVINLDLQRQVSLIFYAGEPDANSPVVWFSSSTDPQKKNAPIQLQNFPTDLNPSFYIGLLHEISHIIDVYNDIGLDPNTGLDTAWNRLAWMRDPQFKKPIDQLTNPWISIFELPNPITGQAAVAPDRPLFKGYFNGIGDQQPAPLTKADSMMRQFAQTTFVTTNAAVTSIEDWCETAMFYYLAKWIKGDETIAIVLKTGESIDLKSRFNSPQFAPKRKFVEDFFNRTDLRYPVPSAPHHEE